MKKANTYLLTMNAFDNSDREVDLENQFICNESIYL